MEHEVFLIPIVAIVGSFLTVIGIVWLVTRSKQRGAQYRAEVQMKLIEKFGSASEFVQFLQSPAGQQFLQEPRRYTRERILRGLGTGIVLSFIGLGFVLMAFVEHDSGFFIAAFILLGLGIGFFIAFFISMKLTKQWETSDLQQQQR